MIGTTHTTTRCLHLSNADFARLTHLLDMAERSMTIAGTYLERLKEDVACARVVPADRMPCDVAGLHAGVSLRLADSAHVTSCWLVLPSEVNARERRISVLSPLGAALIGRHVGDRVEVTTGRNRRQVEILAIMPGAREGLVRPCLPR
jgi:regulator of nucleoside diphosphate kinase